MNKLIAMVLAWLALSFAVSGVALAAPIQLWAPFPHGDQWKAGDSGSFYGEGAHKDSSYWAVDFNRVSGSDVGATICAAADGEVSSVSTVVFEGANCGWSVKIRHSGGYVTQYLHLYDPRTDPGTYVGKPVKHGDPIGKTGFSGTPCLTGPHLHFVLFGPDGNSIQPSPFWENQTLNSNENGKIITGNHGTPSGSDVGYEANDTLHQGIVDCYNRQGEARVGNPSDYVYYWSPGYRQDFDGGSVGASSIFQRTYDNAAYWLHGRIRDKYFGIGGPDSGFHWPEGDQGTAASSPQGTSGEIAAFYQGQIIWPNAGPGAMNEAFPLWGKILDVYRNQDGTGGGLGYPNTSHVDATSPQGTSGQYAGFEGGQVMWPTVGPGATNEAYIISGAILEEHRERGGISQFLGYPQARPVDVSSPYEHTGGMARFEGGDIYSSQLGAYTVPAHFRSVYAEFGGCSGVLGFPISDYRAANPSPDTSGSVQDFEGGRIYSSVRGNCALFGPIFTKYIAMGTTDGVLGFPSSSVQDAPKSPTGTEGKRARFEYGVIHASFPDPYESHGTISEWFYNNGTSGANGFPTSDVGTVPSAVTGIDGKRQSFELVYVTHHPSYPEGVGNSKPIPVYEPILRHYLAAGGAAGGLGYPMGERVPDRGGWKQSFEGGMIESTIEVLAPNGGEHFCAGTKVAVKWRARYLPTEFVKIELSRDNGESWEVLRDTTPNDGSQGVVVTGPATSIARIRVSSVDNPGFTDGGDAVFEIGVPPAAPQNLRATAASTSRIDLAWSDASTNEQSFRIERKVDTGSFAALGTRPAGAMAYVDTTVLGGRTYTYRVFAVGECGPSAPSNEATARTSPPQAPTGLTATTFDKQRIDLRWDDNSDETGYKLERQKGAEAFAEIRVVGKNVTSATDTGLVPNTRYTYRLRAYNAMGNSPHSSYARATTLPLPPAAPTSLIVTVPAAPEGQTRLNLSWADNANNETGFKVLRRTGGATFTEVKVLSANSIGWADSGLAPNTTYEYAVQAFNSGGASANSNRASGKTLPLPPAAPSELAVTVPPAPDGRTKLKLSWIDNANSEGGFRILRKTGSGTFAEIARTGANIVQFQDSGLAPNTRYYYVVRAFNTGGESAGTDKVAATTLP